MRRKSDGTGALPTRTSIMTSSLRSSLSSTGLVAFALGAAVMTAACLGKTTSLGSADDGSPRRLRHRDERARQVDEQRRQLERRKRQRVVLVGEHLVFHVVVFVFLVFLFVGRQRRRVPDRVAASPGRPLPERRVLQVRSWRRRVHGRSLRDEATASSSVMPLDGVWL